MNCFSLKALGTAINSTKVMKAQQVVKTDDGGEVKPAETRDLCFFHDIVKTATLLFREFSHPYLQLRLIYTGMVGLSHL